MNGASGRSFPIDYPRDPENKELQHSFVESPDMMNIYNGNVITDGEAGRRPMTRHELTLAAVLLLIAASARGQTTWYVDDDNCPGPGAGTQGDPFCSIQAAIDASTHGHTVIVSPGTYLESIDFSGKAIIVRSTDPADPGVVASTIIDGTGHDHVVICKSGEGADTALRGFVVTGGDADGAWPDNVGGGMYCDGASPTVGHCSFIENTAEFGGAFVTLNGAAPAIEHCSFLGNTATFSGGGAIYNDNSTPVVHRCAFVGNSAAIYGGAIYNNVSGGTIDNCTFNFNSSDVGGAITGGSSGLLISDCRFNGNSAASFGGGIYFAGASPTLTRTGFWNNVPDAIDGSWTDGGGNSLTFCAPAPPEAASVDPCPADLNDDGTVNVLDLLQMLTDWGVCS